MQVVSQSGPAGTVAITTLTSGLDHELCFRVLGLWGRDLDLRPQNLISSSLSSDAPELFISPNSHKRAIRHCVHRLLGCKHKQTHGHMHTYRQPKNIMPPATF